MARFSKAQEQARNRLLDLAAGGYMPDTLSRLMIAALQQAIGWDGYRLFGVDPSSMLINRLLAASDNDAGVRLEWLREVYLTMPATYAELREISRTGLKVVAYQERQEQCWGYPADHLAVMTPDEHYRYYHEGQSPVGGTILAILRANEVPVAAMQAYRRDPDKPFRAGDVDFLRQVSPIAGRALLTAMARERAMLRGVSETSHPSGILLVGRTGDIRFATPAAEQWLAALGEVEHGLPVPVWAAMAHLRADADRRGAKIVTTQGAVQVEIEASPSGEDGVTAIVLSEHRPAALPEVPLTWPLTMQERLIVQQLLLGRGNRDISDALFIAENTVEWHLRKIYDKLQVRTRQDVVLAVFRQELLPGIEAAEVTSR